MEGSVLWQLTWHQSEDSPRVSILSLCNCTRSIGTKDSKYSHSLATSSQARSLGQTQTQRDQLGTSSRPISHFLRSLRSTGQIPVRSISSSDITLKPSMTQKMTQSRRFRGTSRSFSSMELLGRSSPTITQGFPHYPLGPRLRLCLQKEVRMCRKRYLPDSVGLVLLQAVILRGVAVELTAEPRRRTKRRMTRTIGSEEVSNQ
ncbi:hypothetical protein FGO68_gene12477 [Halteria grandinella]|uniref:Uncharacterized protein n=1 Tax=Halteria grandinella TaxID=5974 RepID=A0A8J8NRH9_HALGN|nr:hypothetical protein FGO68_gene12477 [Halteria grandinella]